jgi:hypothetical protein
MNAIGLKQKDNKINQADCYPAAHNGLVAGWNPAGPGLCAGLWQLINTVGTGGLAVLDEGNNMPSLRHFIQFFDVVFETFNSKEK